MSIYKSLFKQTAIYGIATVLPRVISFILNPLYVFYLTDSSVMGQVAVLFSYLVFFNVILSYGMETSFFRFYNSESDKENVVATATQSVFWSTIGFLVLFLLLRKPIAAWVGIPEEYILFTIWILALDALAIIPFSKIRADKKPLQYAFIKIGNVLLNLGLNVFFLAFLPKLAASSTHVFFQTIYVEDFQIGYIFLSNLIASGFTLALLLPYYFKISWQFDAVLWKKMMRYGSPILIAGIAFAINEHFDKILLDWMHIPMADIGAYSACYKIGMFMVLFRTAYTLGIEPFFFSHSKNENAPQTYATITKYFVIFGSFISLNVIVFADLLKYVLVPNEMYWSAMNVVPLIVIANFFLGIYTNLSVWYKLIDKTSVGAIISLIGALLTLFVNIALIPLISYMGAAIATIFAYGVMMLLSYKLGQKKYPIPYDKKAIFSYLFLAISLSGISFYIPLFRQTFVFGIVAILFFAYFVYKNEKTIILKLLKRN